MSFEQGLPSKAYSPCPGRRGLLLRVAETLLWSAATLLVLATGIPTYEDPPPLAESGGLDAPRDLQPGDWFQVVVKDETTGISVQGTVVVASNDGEEVLFGFDSGALHPLFLNFGSF